MLIILKTIYEYRVVFSLLEKDKKTYSVIAKEWHKNNPRPPYTFYGKACKSLVKKGLVNRIQSDDKKRYYYMPNLKRIRYLYKYSLNKNKVYDVMVDLICNAIKSSNLFKNPSKDDRKVFKNIFKNKSYIKFVKDRLNFRGIEKYIVDMPFWFAQQNKDSKDKIIKDMLGLLRRLSKVDFPF